MIDFRAAMLLLALVPPAHGAADPDRTAAIQLQRFVDSYDAAIAGSPRLNAARQRTIAFGEGALVARSSLLPKVGVSVGRSMNSVDYRSQGAGTFDTRRDYDSRSTSLVLSQPLLDFPAIYGWRRAGAEHEASEIELERELQEFTYEFVEAHLELFRINGKLTLAVMRKDHFESQISKAITMYEQGEGSRIDVAQARMASAKAELERLDLMTSREAISNRVGKLCGSACTTGPLYGQIVAVDLPILNNDAGEWKRNALRSNPLLMAKERSIAAADFAHREANSRRLPSLMLQVSVSDRLSDDAYRVGQSTRGTSVGLELKVPLFEGGSLTAESRRTTALLSEAMYLRDELHQEIEAQVSDALSNAVAGLQRVDALQKLEAATKEMERGAVAGMTAGERSLGDVTAARIESKSAAINTRIERLRAASLLIQLWKLTGELNREKVLVISNGLRPEQI